MSVFTRDGIFESYPNSRKPVLEESEKIEIDPDYGKIPLPTDFLKRLYHNMFHEGTFGDLHKKEKKPTKAGGFPAYLDVGANEIAISEAYRMLFEDAQRTGYIIRERAIEDIRKTGYKFGLDYDADGLEYGNVIEIGSTLPIRKKFEVLAHEYAAKFKRAEGKVHTHYERNGEFVEDDFFKAGRELEKEYVAKATAALLNQN